MRNELSLFGLLGNMCRGFSPSSTLARNRSVRSWQDGVGVFICPQYPPEQQSTVCVSMERAAHWMNQNADPFWSSCNAVTELQWKLERDSSTSEFITVDKCSCRINQLNLSSGSSGNECYPALAQVTLTEQIAGNQQLPADSGICHWGVSLLLQDNRKIDKVITSIQFLSSSSNYHILWYTPAAVWIHCSPPVSSSPLLLPSFTLKLSPRLPHM